MRILLIRPMPSKKAVSIKNFMFGEPLGLESVSTILKELNQEVLFMDLMVDGLSKYTKILKTFKPDVIGITSQCTDIDNVKKISRLAKEINKNIKIVVGGIQVTITPEAYFDRNIDYVFKTTTRENYKHLLEQIMNDSDEEIEGVYSKKRQYQSALSSCQNEYVKPDREITAKYRKNYNYVGYRPCALLQTSYGCKNHCKFCVRWRIEGGKLVEIPIKDVVDEIEAIKEPYIKIIDNDFLVNEERLLEFLDLVEEKQIVKKYVCFGSANSIIEKSHLFERLAKNGLKVVIIGIESCDDAKLKEWDKASTKDETFKAIKILKDYGISVCGNIILDPDFSKEDFKNIVKYHKKLKPEMCTFTPLVPHPLTPLYDKYKDRLLYSIDDYEKWNFGEVIIKPSKMSLSRFYFEMIKLSRPFNFNMTTIKYLFREYPVKNVIKMAFGFKGGAGIYIKHILRRRVK